MYTSYDYQNFYSPDFSFSGRDNAEFAERGPPAGALTPRASPGDGINIVPVEYETIKRSVDERRQSPIGIGVAPTPRSEPFKLFARGKRSLTERFALTGVTALLTIEAVLLVALFVFHTTFGDCLRNAVPFWAKCAAIVVVLVAIVYYANRNAIGVPVF